MTTLGVLLVRFTRSNLTTNTYPRGCRSADLPASVQGLQHTSEHLVRKTLRHSLGRTRWSHLTTQRSQICCPKFVHRSHGSHHEPNYLFYHLTLGGHLPHGDRGPVLRLHHTYSACPFSFFSCYAEIFIVNRLLESQLHYQCPIVSIIDP